MALTPGTRLGVYEVTAQIGEGGMGEVYRATDTKLKRDVAVKVRPCCQPKVRQRFLRLAFTRCLAVAGCLLLGACSGGGTSSDGPTSPTPTSTPTPTTPPTPAPTLPATQVMTAMPVDPAAVRFMAPSDPSHVAFDFGTTTGGRFFSIGAGVVNRIELNTGLGLPGSSYRIVIDYTSMGIEAG